MVIESDSFLFGLFVGFLVAGYLGWIMGRIRADRGVSKKAGQMASVTVKAEKSPSEVVREAAAASMRTFLWAVLLIGSIVGIVYMLWKLAG